MIYQLEDVRQGFDTSADVVVVGSGAAGAVAAANFGAAGMRTVLLEAGPQIDKAEMTRDAPRFIARYFWEGGLRILGGSAQVPSMQGRCLGGSTLVNSAIMYKLPDWVRKIWVEQDGLDFLWDEALDRAFDRVFERTSTAPTPMSVMGRRNLLLRDALEAVGVESGPLPRAVIDCKGCGDCLIGCPDGRKQSVERSYLPDAVRDGVQIYTCAQVDRVLTKGVRAVGVEGQVVDPDGRKRLAPFKVRAPLVILAAGVMATPVILQRSGIHGRGRVGGSLYTHTGGGIVAVMDEPVEPWVGATQGWGAISEEIPGMKFESLWAAPSILTVRWGGVGRKHLERIEDIRFATVGVCVYRAQVNGRIKARRNGLPSTRLWIPRSEMPPVQRGLKLLADAFLKVGARYTYAGIGGTKDEMRTPNDTEAILNPKIRARDLPFTVNHVFGSCRMSTDPGRGAVDPRGKVYGVKDLYVCDTSIFPSGSAVNPQATVMALADVITRRLADLRA